MGSLKDKARSYSKTLAEINPLIDEASRLNKAAKIKAVLDQEWLLLPSGICMLEIGCSYGLILKKLAEDFGFCVGIEIDQHALAQAAKGVSYVRADGEMLPLKTNCVDIVICNHVYEHTDSPEQLLAEIERVLKPGGICYFAGPNKYALVEPHYRLPFLSWLPPHLADIYVRLFGKGQAYPERPYSYRGAKRLAWRFRVSDYTGKILDDPARYHATDMIAPKSIKRLFAIIVFRVLTVIFPTFVFILRKGV